MITSLLEFRLLLPVYLSDHCLAFPCFDHDDDDGDGVVVVVVAIDGDDDEDEGNDS